MLPVSPRENHLHQHSPLGLSETQLSVSRVDSEILMLPHWLAELWGCGPRQKTLRQREDLSPNPMIIKTHGHHLPQASHFWAV